MVWFLLNIPLAAACFAAWFGIPLWMVLRHQNWGPAHHSDGYYPWMPAEPEPVLAPGRGADLVGAVPAGAGSGISR